MESTGDIFTYKGLTKFLDMVNAKSMEDYSSMIGKDNDYITVQRYRNFITDTTLVGDADNSYPEFDKKHIMINYKIADMMRFKSLLDRDTYTGRDYHDILNSGIKDKPIIETGNGHGFDLSVSIPRDKHIMLTIPNNRCTVTKCRRVEVYPYEKEETDWSKLLEVYQLYPDGYCYVNNGKRSRSYEHIYLNGGVAHASSFVNKKNMSGELYLDMNPKYICWIGNGDTVDAEFKIEYDKSGIVKNIYGLKSTPYKDKTLCKHYVTSDKSIISFHLMLFDPFNFDNFTSNNWNLWVVERRKLDFGFYIYDRDLFWIDKDKVFKNIDQLEFE